jgi:hypothetical protein
MLCFIFIFPIRSSRLTLFLMKSQIFEYRYRQSENGSNELGSAAAQGVTVLVVHLMLSALYIRLVVFTHSQGMIKKFIETIFSYPT